MHQRCIACKQEKDISEFYKQGNGRTDYKTSCKQCCNKYSSKYQSTHRKQANEQVANYRRRHPEKIRSYNHTHKKERREAVKRYNSRNKEKVRKYMSSYNKRYMQSLSGKYHQWQTRVKLLEKKGIISSMNRMQWETFWQKPCHYCGYQIATIGIDRVDNSIGYNLENCVPCCTICNRAKGELSIKEFSLWINEITKALLHGAHLDRLNGSKY